jgi:hypothetical protein
MRNTMQELQMSPGRAGRFSGLIFVLIVVLGGLGAAGADVQATATGHGATIQMNSLNFEWD